MDKWLRFFVGPDLLPLNNPAESKHEGKGPLQDRLSQLLMTDWVQECMDYPVEGTVPGARLKGVWEQGSWVWEMLWTVVNGGHRLKILNNSHKNG